jgi:hypothetical protein
MPDRILPAAALNPPVACADPPCNGVADITANVAMLSPKAGDIVHVRLHRQLANHEMVALMDQLSAIAPDARFLVTDGVLDLNLLTSAQLAEIGLARIASRLVLPH